MKGKRERKKKGERERKKERREKERKKERGKRKKWGGKKEKGKKKTIRDDRTTDLQLEKPVPLLLIGPWVFLAQTIFVWTIWISFFSTRATTFIK